uniref:Uncharacterized protein n=1 Tax=Panagrolaimus superbus TaxID=310955 RepID=A0A914YMW2_9BILA
MSQGKVLVEFKKANGGDIEVSEEKFLQSKMCCGTPKQSPGREMSPDVFSDITEPFSDMTNRYPYDPPKTPFIIQNTAKFKPFTPPTISAELRKEMVAKRNSERKRKAEDELPIPSTPAATFIPTASPLITPEMRERSRRNREAALAKRKSLQSNQSFNSM